MYLFSACMVYTAHHYRCSPADVIKPTLSLKKLCNKRCVILNIYMLSHLKMEPKM